MRRILKSCFVLATVALVGSTALAQTTSAPVATAPAPLEAKWVNLLTRLGAEDFKTRNAAQEELKKIANSDRPILEQLLKEATDPEVKSRLIERLSEMEVEVSLNPPLVTIELKNQTIWDAFEQLSKQTGTKIAGWPDWRGRGAPAEKAITLKIENQPFWVAVARLAEEVPFSVMSSMGRGSLQLNVQGQTGRMVSHGPLMFTLDSITRQYSVNFLSKPEKEEIRSNFCLNLHMAMDPRVWVVRRQEVDEFVFAQLEDENGNSLLKEPKPKNPLWWQEGTVSLNIPLVYPEKPGKKIAILKGSVKYTAVARTASLEFKKIGKEEVSDNLNGAKVTLKSVTTQGSSTRIKVDVNRGTMPPEAWKLVGSSGDGVQMRVEATDEKGVALAASSGGGSWGGDNISYEYYMSRREDRGKAEMGEPVKIRILIPTEVREITAPIEIRDLPLP